jgi:hypothetical protein
VNADEEIAVGTHEYALSRGRHVSPDRGRCAMEWVAQLTGEAHTDRPGATSAVAAEYVRHLNDVLPDGPRQRLRPYLSRMIGTAGDGLDEQRAWTCTLRLARTCLPAALDAAGLDEHARRVRFAPAAELGGAVAEARAAAADARSAARARASRACVPAEWSLQRERARAAARAAGRAAALDASRVALAVAGPDPERSVLAETAWAAAWDALWAAAWDSRAMPSAEPLRAGAFDLLDQMLPGEWLDAAERELAASAGS